MMHYSRSVSRMLAFFLLTTSFTVYFTYASPLDGSPRSLRPNAIPTEQDLSPRNNGGQCTSGNGPSGSSRPSSAYQCTLLENFKTPLPDPQAWQYAKYLPAWYTDPKAKTDSHRIKGSVYPQKYHCEHQIASPGRRDEKDPAATGILCSVGPPSSNMMMKIIRKVPVTWDKKETYFPPRLEWELEALYLTGKLIPGVPHQWGYWIDPASTKQAATGRYGGMAEVYIRVSKEEGYVLKEFPMYLGLGIPAQRKAFLGHLKQLVAERIMYHANHDHIFHGNLKLANIHIIQRPYCTFTMFEPSCLEVRFSDWGYTRKVDGQLQTCTDRWIIPGLMFFCDGNGPISSYIHKYVDNVFQFPEMHVGDARGGVDHWDWH